MKRILLLGILVAAAGCGGSGVSTPSPFAGTWNGSWTANDVGTGSITVATNGAVTGTLHDTTANADGTVTGSISNAGTISGVVHYSGVPNTTLTGTMAIAGNGHLTGNLTQSDGVNSIGVSFDLIKQ